jgi:hypothetical protein
MRSTCGRIRSTRKRADHIAMCAGLDRAVKTSASSWDDGEDLSGARRSCEGTKVYRSGLEKTKVEHHRRTENSATVGVERGQRGVD